MRSRRKLGAVRNPRARRASTAKSLSVGRPRDARIDGEVVAAVLTALQGGGYKAVTIDGVARAVGRARSSIYRRWPSKSHIVAYAVVGEVVELPWAFGPGSSNYDVERCEPTSGSRAWNTVVRPERLLAADAARPPLRSGPPPLRGSVQLRLRRSCRTPLGLRPREFEFRTSISRNRQGFSGND